MSCLRCLYNEYRIVHMVPATVTATTTEVRAALYGWPVFRCPHCGMVCGSLK